MSAYDPLRATIDQFVTSGSVRMAPESFDAGW